MNKLKQSKNNKDKTKQQTNTNITKQQTKNEYHPAREYLFFQ